MASAEVIHKGDATSKSAVKDGAQHNGAQHEVQNERQNGTAKTTDTHASAQAHVDQVYGKVEIVDSSKAQGQAKSDGQTTSANNSSDHAAKPADAAKPQESWASSMLHQAEAKVGQAAHSVENKVEQAAHTVTHDAKATRQWLHNAGDVAAQVAIGTGKEFVKTAENMEHGAVKAAEWAKEHPKTAIAIGVAAVGVAAAEVATGGTITPFLVAAASSEAAAATGTGYAIFKTGEAVHKVAASGDASTIMHQQDLNKTADGHAKVEAAKEHVQEDTGKAGMTVASMAGGALFKAAKSMLGAVHAVEAAPVAAEAAEAAAAAERGAKAAAGIVKDLGSNAYKLKGVAGNVSEFVEKAIGHTILHPVHAGDIKPQATPAATDTSGHDLHGGYTINLNPAQAAATASH